MSWVKLSTKIGEAQTGFVEDKNILRNHFLPNLYRYSNIKNPTKQESISKPTTP